MLRRTTRLSLIVALDSAAGRYRFVVILTLWRDAIRWLQCSAIRGGRGYQRPDDAPRARQSVSILRVRACDPSTNRNARSGITPPTILGSRHFHSSIIVPLPRPPRTLTVRGRNGFFFTFSTIFCFISSFRFTTALAVRKTIATATVLPRSTSLSCLASVRIISLNNILKSKQTL